MVDQRKRRSMQLVSTGLAALAGISSGSATMNNSGALQDYKGSKKSKGRKRPQIVLEGDLYSTSKHSGQKEVPPNDSSGEGVTAVRATTDESRLDFAHLAINATSQITAAHIHLGEEGENGPVVASLIGEEVDAQQILILNNVASSGSIRASDLVGPLEGGSIADLIEEIESGNAYVNVHTEEYPDGELRSQIYSAKKLDVAFKGKVTGVSPDSVIGIWYDLDLKVRLKTQDGRYPGGDDGRCKPRHGGKGKKGRGKGKKHGRGKNGRGKKNRS